MGAPSEGLSASARPRTHRRRLPRAKSKNIRFWHFNVSGGRDQLNDVMEAALDSEEPPAAIGISETWFRDGVPTDIWRERLQRRRWHSAVAHAGTGPRGGSSAGVAVFAPASHHSLTKPMQEKYDFSPEGSQGRLIATVVGMRRAEAILYAEAYFWTNEHIFSERNYV